VKTAEMTPRKEEPAPTHLGIQESTVGNFDVPDEDGHDKNDLSHTK